MVTIPPQGDGTPVSARTKASSSDDERRFRETERQLRGAAGSFGADAERYDRARPTYPDAMVEAIVAASPGTDVLDVGIGTGIAARLFKARGCDVLGVDVDDRMAQIARRNGIDVEIAKFEDWNPRGRVFDTVVAAQTWHWIDPVAGAVKAAEVLAANGRIALCWNVFQPPPAIAAMFSEVSRGILPDSIPDVWKRPAMEGYGMLARRAEDGIRESGAFTEPEQWRFDWQRTYTTAGWLDQLPTSGGFARIPPDQVDRLLAKTGAAIDALGGAFVMEYSTMVVTAAKAAV
ncbi:class I SAM-dependent methyltransferase [Glycomyces algeriensis]|uniref:Methyltransferase type 11 n=1 Tax=Glycomyces algeriensis TaxID=256037 RepID=A0A9W6GBT8_9ACTN|nr:class I SAM-dependent methyltransferase [Glycomyces algeriensis]MDA1365602.1 class I SAM-dependent methyltransferase [Glycomyces algeriensis]MDR7351290.1 SAM-dependent methyltransferase [Glycomyces algeriensis]GLI44005.1 methyltransferase type 11 [Glycomyces algeriensis]